MKATSGNLYRLILAVTVDHDHTEFNKWPEQIQTNLILDSKLELQFVFKSTDQVRPVSMCKTLTERSFNIGPISEQQSLHDCDDDDDDDD